MIGSHPEIGQERSELSDAPFRFVMVKGYPYLIAYDASRIPPLVARIFHTSRDLPALFETDAR
jgi:toxin ParE1/3/4